MPIHLVNYPFKSPTIIYDIFLNLDNNNSMKHIKRNILISIFLLMIISIINIYNAKYLNSLYTYYYIKDIIWYVLGFITFFFITKINTKKIFNISFILYIINIILLILTLIIGKEINGSKGWLKIGSISIQPSEFMKLTFTIFLIKVSLIKEKNSKNILKLLIITFIPSLLVFLEPDTGAIIFYIIIFITILFTKNINKKYKIILSISLFLIFILGIYIIKNPLLIQNIFNNESYRIKRILNYRQSYQMDMALTNIYSTPFIRNGFNKILLYLPEGITDFILDFTIGNFGFISLYIILLLYLNIIFNLCKLIKSSNDKKTNYLIISFIIMFFINIAINVSMNLGTFPIIGITLPFLSYGGSSLLFYFIFIGLIFSLVNKDT